MNVFQKQVGWGTWLLLSLQMYQYIWRDSSNRSRFQIHHFLLELWGTKLVFFPVDGCDTANGAFHLSISRISSIFFRISRIVSIFPSLLTIYKMLSISKSCQTIDMKTQATGTVALEEALISSPAALSIFEIRARSIRPQLTWSGWW